MWPDIMTAMRQVFILWPVCGESAIPETGGFCNKNQIKRNHILLKDYKRCRFYIIVKLYEFSDIME